MEIKDVMDVVGGQGLAIALILFVAWFLRFSLWPYVTQIYLPGKRAHELKTLELLQRISLHLENQSVALEAFAAQMARLVETQRGFQSKQSSPAGEREP